MPRIRSIKPEFWTDEKIIQLPFEARLLFIGLWNFCDDDGFLIEEPERIRLQVLPNDPINSSLLLDLLVASGLLERVILADNRRVLSVKNFHIHQKISHKTDTRIPIGGAAKQGIYPSLRRHIAIKYGCIPGHTIQAECHHCGAVGHIHWMLLPNGAPSSWIALGNLELDGEILDDSHTTPENSGEHPELSGIVLSCRLCSKSNGMFGGDIFFRKIPENSGILSPDKDKDKDKDKDMEEDKDSKITPSGSPPPYFYENGRIRLIERDYRRWESSFTEINLRAELEALAPWAESLGGKWFHGVSGALAKRNREAKIQREAVKAGIDAARRVRTGGGTA